MTVWPSGLRRWLQAPVRKGVGSKSTAVTCGERREEHLRVCAEAEGMYLCSGKEKHGLALVIKPCLCHDASRRHMCSFQEFIDGLAEWSKALASGASP